MSAEENKGIALRFVTELWNTKNYGLVDELCAPEFVAHDLPASVPGNREGFKKIVTAICSGFPDANFTTRDIIAEKDKVVVRWDATGTHKGAFMGMPETNKKGSWSGITIYRMAGHKLVEWWNQSGFSTMIQQLRQP